MPDHYTIPQARDRACGIVQWLAPQTLNLVTPVRIRVLQIILPVGAASYISLGVVPQVLTSLGGNKC